MVVVIVLLIGMLSAVHFAILKQRKTEYNEKLIKMVLSNAGPAQGGTREVKAIPAFSFLFLLCLFLFMMLSFQLCLWVYTCSSLLPRIWF